MIKINVISNNILWKKTLKNPQSYFDNKLKKINLNNDLFKKKDLYALCFYLTQRK